VLALKALSFTPNGFDGTGTALTGAAGRSVDGTGAVGAAGAVLGFPSPVSRSAWDASGMVAKMALRAICTKTFRL